ncbi:MAG TPA: hypothetical protein PLB62_15585, partial [Candidatus Sumerlaeota bacterium]|nr:hypothetical protein [Candidatus Sumerlaeota bacterium]
MKQQESQVLRHLRKFCHLIILSMLLILPLVYPLKLGEEIIRTLATAFENTGPAWKLIWDWQLEPYLY